MQPSVERETGIEPASLAWKARVLPLNYSRISGGGGWIRTTVGVSQQIYSLPPLATRAPLRRACDYNTDGAVPKSQSSTPPPAAARNWLARLKWPQPMKGTGGRSAAKGDGWLHASTRCWRPCTGGISRRLACACAPPQHEDLGALIDPQGTADCVSEHVPTQFRMAARSAFLDGQAGVKQQHAALRPGQQRTRSGRRQTQVAAQFLEDVAQAGRNGHTGRDRERQAVGLPRPVVRVLAQDQHPGLRQWRQLHRTEDGARMDSAASRDTAVHGVDQPGTDRAVAPGLQQPLPVAEVVLQQPAQRLVEPGQDRPLRQSGWPAPRRDRPRA